VLGIISQNTSLKSVAVNFGEFFKEDVMMMKEVKNSRLAALIELVILIFTIVRPSASWVIAPSLYDIELRLLVLFFRGT